jgi:hypothetical protein
MKVRELTRTGNGLGLPEQAAVTAGRHLQALRTGWKNELIQQLVRVPWRGLFSRSGSLPQPAPVEARPAGRVVSKCHS